MRRFCRLGYRFLAENKLMRKLYFLGHTPKIGMMLTGVCVMGLQSLYDLMLDTYPPLYADLRFAPWPEEDDPENYCLISSSDGGVIRRSTSYCAWKIFELTGSFPIRKTRRRLDARDWVEFLAEAGYTNCVEQPLPDHHYVGVIPGEGEFGQVVWYGFSGQQAALPSECSKPEIDYFCTTYENFAFKVCQIEHARRDVTWVQID